MIMKKKGLIIILLSAILCASLPIPGMNGQAATVSTAAGVTQEMCRASYWKKSSLNCADRPLMNREQIEAINEEGFKGSGTGIQWNDPSGLRTQQYITIERMVDSITAEFDQKTTLYVDGVAVSRAAYLEGLGEKAKATGCPDAARPAKFAICTTRTEVKAIPTDRFIGYSTQYDRADTACQPEGGPFPDGRRRERAVY